MSRRGLLIALFVSLAINLFLLGGLAGAVLLGVGRHPPPQGPLRMAGMGMALSPEHREAWQATVRGAVETAGPQLRQARALRRQAWSSIASEPANPQAALTALDQARALEGQGRAAMDRAVVNFAATLPAAERAKLAEALSKRFRPPHGAPFLGGRPGMDRPPLPDR
jgi:uncharacterized membrane protein